MRYLWVAELQQRGAVHYHAVVWLPKGVRLPKPDKRGWWRHGSSNIQGVKRSAVGYLMKYVSKGGLGQFPRGCRLCGSGGLDAPASAEFHYWRLPRYMREVMEIGQRAGRVPGGGWMCRETGEMRRSEFGLLGIGRVTREANGRKWQVAAPILVEGLPEREKAPSGFERMCAVWARRDDGRVVTLREACADAYALHLAAQSQRRLDSLEPALTPIEWAEAGFVSMPVEWIWYGWPGGWDTTDIF